MPVAGSTVRLTYTSLVNGVATNATTVQVTIQRPDGTLDGPYTLAAAQVVKSGIGQYRYDYPTLVTGPTGQYVALWQSNLGVERAEFDVTRAFAAAPNVWNALSRMVAAESTPAMTDDDLDALVALADRGDGTYDLRRAAAEGWRWKAARVAGAFNLSIDGGAINRGDLLDHCERMIKMYSRQAPRSVVLVNGEADERLAYYNWPEVWA